MLGDRVRMQQHAGDEGVFIRSMATRGHLGGLASATGDVALVLDAAGYDVVLIETVGVGQDEIDVVRTADIAVVVVVPGTGDDVQALKAGIMEIADIYVVNKADREGADRAAASIEALLALQPEGEAWRPPILRTEATAGIGIIQLVEAIDRFRSRGPAQVDARRRLRAGARVKDLVARRLLAHVEQALLAPGEFETLLDRIARRETDPHLVASGWRPGCSSTADPSAATVLGPRATAVRLPAPGWTSWPRATHHVVLAGALMPCTPVWVRYPGPDISGPVTQRSVPFPVSRFRDPAIRGSRHPVPGTRSRLPPPDSRLPTPVPSVYVHHDRHHRR